MNQGESEQIALRRLAGQEPRDGIPRGEVALKLEDRAVRVLNEAERQIDAAYQEGFIAGYLARYEDEED